MPDWESQPLLSGSVARSIASDDGTVLISSAYDDPTQNIDPRYTDFVLYGVYNGAFARGPRFDPYGPIDENNPLPDWDGPTQVSGGAITAAWVDDASSPSGHNLRFTINPGAAGDEAYFEQVVPVAGTRLQRFGTYQRASFYRVTASGGAPLATVSGQYLKADRTTTTGSSYSATKTLSADATLYAVSAVASGGPPADAYFLRIRIDVQRNTMATTDTATVDITDVREDRGGAVVLVPDSADPTKAPGQVYQLSGFMYASPGDGTGVVQMGGSDHLLSTKLTIPEISAPGTPGSGYYAIYAKTDGILYGKNDGGTEVALGGGGGSTVTVMTTPGSTNWTPAASSKAVRVGLVGAGGGGASGACGGNGAVRAGGGGGGGGSIVWRDFRISDLTTPVSVTVGTGGPGGAHAGTTAHDGFAGTAGGNTTFGAYLTAYGGGGGIATANTIAAETGGAGGGSAGVGANGATATTNLGGSPAATAGADGISGQGGGSNSASHGGAAEFGGGAGGGHTTAAGGNQQGGDSIFAAGGGGAGGNGGSSQNAGAAGGGVKTYTSGNGGGGGAVRSAGTPGASGAGVTGGQGGGGGGGSSSTTVDGGAGAAGGLWGGGGGGGGAGTSGGSAFSGKGGDGGNGGAIIIEW